MEPSQPQLFEQYAEVLRVLASRRPLLLLLDDLQWADAGSRGLLFHLGRRLAEVPVLVLGAYRSDEVALGDPAEGGRHPLVAVVNELRRLHGDVLLLLDHVGTTQARAFVDALLDSEPNRLDEAFREELQRRTEGHPLFTVELLRDLQARNDLVRDERGRWVQQSTFDWSSMPARIEAVINQRLGRLEPSLRELLAVASVEGEAFTAEVLAQVQGLGALEVLRLLDRDLANRHRLVREEAEERIGTRLLARYRFAHVLFQQFLYQELGRGRRRVLHDAVAQALEELQGEGSDDLIPQIAHHYRLAGESEKAVRYLELAGDRARRLVALGEATEFYRLALDSLSAGGSAVRARLLRKLGEACWLVGRHPEALGAFEAAQALFLELGEVTEAGVLHRLLGRIHWEDNDRRKALEHYHRAVEVLRRGPESVELAWAISSISQMHMLAGEFRAAIREGEQALALAEQLGAEGVQAHALNNLGSSWAGLGEIEQGVEMLEESLRRSEDLGLPHDACRARQNLAEVLITVGRYQEARDLLRTQLAFVERTGIAHFDHAAMVYLLLLAWRQGQWRIAFGHRDVLEGADRTNSRPLLAILPVIGALVENDLGRNREAAALLEAAREEIERIGEAQIIAPFLGELGRAHAGLGRYPEAVASFREMAALTPSGSGVHYAAHLTAGCICLASGGDASISLARALQEQLEWLTGRIDSLEAHAGLAECRAVLAQAQGRDEEAARGFKRSALAWGELGHPYDRLRALAGLGACLKRLGAAPEARAAFAEARAIAEDLAAQLDDAERKASFLAVPFVRRAWERTG